MSDKDAAAVRFPPPLVYVLAALLGVGLQGFALPLPSPLAFAPRMILCALSGAAAVALMLAAFRRFQQTGQNPKPWTATPEIIADGIYRYTRNPMYVSMALMQASLGLGLANPWIVVLMPASLITVYFIAVRHEEAYLTRKFGESYLNYKQSVRRWI